MSGQKILDLTDPQIALQWDYVAKMTHPEACREIGALAKTQGYDAIVFESYRGEGINYVIYNNFDDILSPRIVTPIE